MAHQLNYSGLDRLLHRVAFAGPFVQLTAADIEQTMYGASYRDVRARRPIFVTSLPRAGTTLMLEALSRFPSLASHTYRDMPFVMAPVLWSRLSGPFRQPAHLAERAHGDGVEVGFDSPEAFEEVFWRTFWPRKYTPHGIELWSASDAQSEARSFLADHMKKIIALRRPDRADDGRYLSKNNGNVARLALLRTLFPDATTLLLVREPLAHARSLLRQHQNFLSMHRETPFVRRYMADIGHYEFGQIHRPILFPAFTELTSGADMMSLAYWLGYWTAAFEHVVNEAEHVTIVSYDDACAEPERAMAAIVERCGIDENGAVAQAAALFHESPARAVTADGIDSRLLERARHLHATLRNRAVNLSMP